MLIQFLHSYIELFLFKAKRFVGCNYKTKVETKIKKLKRKMKDMHKKIVRSQKKLLTS